MDNCSNSKKDLSNLSKEEIIKKAFEYHAKGNILEAQKYYKYFLEKGFMNKNVLINYAIINLGKGEINQALELFIKTIHLYPNDFEAYYNLGKIYLNSSKKEEAEFYTRKAIKLKPNLFDAYLNLGSILKDLGKLKEAEDTQRIALSLKPKSPIANNNLGAILIELNEFKEAEIYLNIAITLEPNFADAYYNLSKVLSANYNFEEAEKNIIKVINLKPSMASAYANYGGILIALRRFKEAEVSTRKAIKLDSNIPDTYLNMGKILYEANNLKDAEIFTNKAISLNPSLVEAYSHLAIILRLKGDLLEAERFAYKALDLNPNITSAIITISICFFAKNDIKNAFDTIDKAFKIDRDNNNIKLLYYYFRSIKAQTTNISDSIKRLSEFKLSSNPSIINLSVDQKLIDKLYQLDSRNQEKYQSPTFGDAIGSDYSLFATDDFIIQETRKVITKVLEESINSNIFISESFFTIFKSGGGLKMHNHIAKIDQDPALNLYKNKFVSVFYLDTGDQDCINPGILKLSDPEEEILPCKGMLIVFPANRMHSVFYEGKKDRVILGVNFYALVQNNH